MRWSSSFPRPLVVEREEVMTRYLLRLWLGMGVLAATALTGCSHCHHDTVAKVVTPVPQDVWVPVVVAQETMVQAAPEPSPAQPEVVTVAHQPTEDFRGGESLYSQMQRRLRDRRDFGDITANPAFAHDSNYGWLVGMLEKGPGAVLSLRYTSIDDEDRYGGHVSLSGSQALSDFLPGEIVRVEGQMGTESSSDSWPV